MAPKSIFVIFKIDCGLNVRSKGVKKDAFAFKKLVKIDWAFKQLFTSVIWSTLDSYYVRNRYETLDSVFKAKIFVSFDCNCIEFCLTGTEKCVIRAEQLPSGQPILLPAACMH